MATVHEFPTTESQPVHPEKVELGPPVAVSVTDVPESKDGAHVEPQSTPAGELETDPDPLPLFVTVSVLGWIEKVAVTFLTEVIATVQVVPLVESQPLHDSSA